MAKKILIVAGEVSGDTHAAHLVKKLKERNKELSFYGLGGQQLKNEGVEILCDITQKAVVGFVEILKSYATFKNIFEALLERTRLEKPDAAILVDYPGFNLRLAKELKALNIKVIYFISPQVWAWGQDRIPFIKTHVDLMLVFFKFEKILYGDKEFNVKFVGHPLLDTAKTHPRNNNFIEEAGLKKSFTTIALLPGSREREVKFLLPAMLKGAQQIFKGRPQTQFLICRSPNLGRQLYKEIVERANVDFTYKIVDNATYDAIQAARLALVASGTATLETAILNTPMIILYKTSFLTWLIAKLCIKIPYIGLVNVVAGSKIVPELVQYDCTPAKITRTALELLNNPQKIEKTQAELYALKNTLGIPGATQRAADEIAAFLNIS